MKKLPFAVLAVSAGALVALSSAAAPPGGGGRNAGPPGGGGGYHGGRAGGSGGGGGAYHASGGGRAYPGHGGYRGWRGGYPGYAGWRGAYWGPRYYYGGPGYWGGWPYAWAAWPGAVALSYGVGYGAAPLVINTVNQPSTFLEIEPAATAPQPIAEPNYWYYCVKPAGYFPYVNDCSQPWMKVVPQAPGDSAAPRLAP
jgi:hypothetical protein